MQEHELPFVLGCVEVYVVAMLDFLREGREFEVVRGEQGERTDFFTHVMRGRPGERQTIERAGAAPDFIHEHKALLGCVVEDRRSLGHLDHER